MHARDLPERRKRSRPATVIKGITGFERLVSRIHHQPVAMRGEQPIWLLDF